MWWAILRTKSPLRSHWRAAFRQVAIWTWYHLRVIISLRLLKSSENLPQVSPMLRPRRAQSTSSSSLRRIQSLSKHLRSRIAKVHPSRDRRRPVLLGRSINIRISPVPPSSGLRWGGRRKRSDWDSSKSMSSRWLVRLRIVKTRWIESLRSARSPQVLFSLNLPSCANLSLKPTSRSREWRRRLWNIRVALPLLRSSRTRVLRSRSVSTILSSRRRIPLPCRLPKNLQIRWRWPTKNSTRTISNRIMPKSIYRRKKLRRKTISKNTLM